ncbi:hypothetical protein MLD38_021553 [Melastoma candidum]|uniref:Uncharacterized protein n=1 Tax=Melastoma candidum TaxID=119954 RepID=A0ACB9QFP2_9MYRT|nr:hypothetical protein MLD38_021553 [Melastoma candidum]
MDDGTEDVRVSGNERWLPLSALLDVQSTTFQTALPHYAMTKVHPNEKPEKIVGVEAGVVIVLTVWTKSLVPNSKGFTVFDCDGNLVFRVDGYASGDKGEVVLMDAVGSPLFTARRKSQKLSLGESWLLFVGETTTNPILKAKKKQSNAKPPFLQVSSYSNDVHEPALAKTVKYEIEGSYTQRSCTVYDENRKVVAEIATKAGLGTEVFRLVVQPSIDQATAMALVILLDRVFRSSSKLF